MVLMEIHFTMRGFAYCCFSCLKEWSCAIFTVFAAFHCDNLIHRDPNITTPHFTETSGVRNDKLRCARAHTGKIAPDFMNRTRHNRHYLIGHTCTGKCHRKLNF